MKASVNRYMIVGFFAFVLIGCSDERDSVNKAGADSGVVVPQSGSDALSPQEYVAWVKTPDNGLQRTKIVDELSFQVQYKPYDYIICMEERSPVIYDSLVSRRRKEFDGMVFFDLKIAMNEGGQELLRYGVANPQEYDQRVKYFAFDMQEDIQLLDGTDTLRCDFYHFERTFGISPECTILLGFSPLKKDDQKEKTLLVYDRTFHKGLLKFKFDETSLLNIPKLETL